MSPSLRGRGLKCQYETSNAPTPAASPSLRGRGLKYVGAGAHRKVLPVALFARAWIEIQSQNTTPQYSLSPSLRGRGLK